MRWSIASILICLLAAPALGEDDARKSQVAAANADAYDTLRREVLATPLTIDMTVGDFIARTGASEQIDEMLHSADVIGGARWIDDQTVQVRLELRGADLSTTILKIASKHPKESPVPLGTLRNRLNTTFFRRSFSSTGTSTGGAGADRLRPDETQVAWRNVSADNRRAAIDAARRNAVDRVVDSLKPLPIEWEPTKKLGDAIDVPAVNEPIRDWIGSRPITSIQFRDDLEVRLTLSCSPQELWPALKRGLEKQAVVPAPKAPAGWDLLRNLAIERMAPALGIALAHSTPATTRIVTVAIPNQPPAWIEGVAEADGVSPSLNGSKLKTARAAQAIALQNLRSQLNELPLNPKTALGEAARQDPRIDAALSRGVSRARLTKVEYDTPVRGAARAKVSLDLQELWTELSGQ